MSPSVANEAAEHHVTGNVRVTAGGRTRKYIAQWVDRDGVRRTRTLGEAHIRDSGRRTTRGAVVWRAGAGACPPGAVTPKMAEQQLAAILEAARRAPRKVRVVARPAERVPTFGDAVDLWLAYLEKEKRRKPSTLQDARNVANAYLLPHFGKDTPLYASEAQEFVVVRDGREQFEKREVRRDAFETEDVDDFRRELLDTELSPRTVQKILVLLHGVFKLARRRKPIQANPSEDLSAWRWRTPGCSTCWSRPSSSWSIARFSVRWTSGRSRRVRRKTTMTRSTHCPMTIGGSTALR